MARTALAILVELEQDVELGTFQASRFLLHNVPVVRLEDLLSLFVNLVFDYFA